MGSPGAVVEGDGVIHVLEIPRDSAAIARSFTRTAAAHIDCATMTPSLARAVRSALLSAVAALDEGLAAVAAIEGKEVEGAADGRREV